jgi:hypothetical protein
MIGRNPVFTYLIVGKNYALLFVKHKALTNLNYLSTLEKRGRVLRAPSVGTEDYSTASVQVLVSHYLPYRRVAPS